MKHLHLQQMHNAFRTKPDLQVYFFTIKPPCLKDLCISKKKCTSFSYVFHDFE